MRPLNLREFAEELRRDTDADFRTMEFADEILALLDIEAEVAEPYSTLCDDIERYAKNFSNPDDAAKALEWLGDRSNLLADIEKQIEEADRGVKDADDAVKEMIGTLGEAEDILREHGWDGDGDFLEALREMTSPIARMEYDL